MKKAISVLLSLVIVLSSLCFSSTVFAADTTTTTVTVKYYQTDARNMLKKVNAFKQERMHGIGMKQTAKKSSVKTFPS